MVSPATKPEAASPAALRQVENENEEAAKRAPAPGQASAINSPPPAAAFDKAIQQAKAAKGNATAQPQPNPATTAQSAANAAPQAGPVTQQHAATGAPAGADQTVTVTPATSDNGDVQTTVTRDNKTGRTVTEYRDFQHDTHYTTVTEPGRATTTSPMRDGSDRKITNSYNPATGAVTTRTEADLGDRTVVQTTALPSGTRIQQTTDVGGRTTSMITAPDGHQTTLAPGQQVGGPDASSIATEVGKGKTVEQVAAERGLTPQQVAAELNASGLSVRTRAPSSDTGDVATTEIVDDRSGRVVSGYYTDYQHNARTSFVTDAGGRQITVTDDGNGRTSNTVFTPETGELTSRSVDPQSRTTTDTVVDRYGRTTRTVDDPNGRTVDVTANGVTLTTAPNGAQILRTDNGGPQVTIKPGSSDAAIAQALIEANPASSDPVTARLDQVVVSTSKALLFSQNIEGVQSAAKTATAARIAAENQYGTGQAGEKPQGKAPSGGDWVQVGGVWIDPEVAKARAAENTAVAQFIETSATAGQAQAQLDVYATDPAYKNAVSGAETVLNHALAPHHLVLNIPQGKGSLAEAQTHLAAANNALEQASGARAAYQAAQITLGQAITQQAALPPPVVVATRDHPVMSSPGGYDQRAAEAAAAHRAAAEARVKALFAEAGLQTATGDKLLADYGVTVSQTQLAATTPGTPEHTQAQQAYDAAVRQQEIAASNLDVAGANLRYQIANADLKTLQAQGGDMAAQIAAQHRRDHPDLYDPNKKYSTNGGDYLGKITDQRVVEDPNDHQLYLETTYEHSDGPKRTQLTFASDDTNVRQDLKDNPLNLQWQNLVNGARGQNGAGGLSAASTTELNARVGLVNAQIRQNELAASYLDKTLTELRTARDGIPLQGPALPQTAQLDQAIREAEAQKAALGSAHQMAVAARDRLDFALTQPLKLLNDAGTQAYTANLEYTFLEQSRETALNTYQPQFRELYDKGFNGGSRAVTDSDIAAALGVDANSTEGREAVDKVRQEFGNIAGVDNPNVRTVPLLYVDVQGSQQIALFAVNDASGNTHYVDRTGKSFDNLIDFQNNNNQFGEDGRLIAPAELSMTPDANGAIPLEAVQARKLSAWERVVDPAVGVITGAATIGSFFLPVLAPVAMAGGAYLATRAVIKEANHLQHGGEWNETQSLMNMGMIAAAPLPMASSALRTAGLAGIGLTRTEAALGSMGLLERGASGAEMASTYLSSTNALNRTVRGLDWAAMGISSPLVGMQAYELAAHGDQMSSVDRLNAVLGLVAGVAGTGLGGRGLLMTRPGRAPAVDPAQQSVIWAHEMPNGSVHFSRVGEDGSVTADFSSPFANGERPQRITILHTALGERGGRVGVRRVDMYLKEDGAYRSVVTDAAGRVYRSDGLGVPVQSTRQDTTGYAPQNADGSYRVTDLGEPAANGHSYTDAQTTPPRDAIANGRPELMSGRNGHAPADRVAIRLSPDMGGRSAQALAQQEEAALQERYRAVFDALSARSTANSLSAAGKDDHPVQPSRRGNLPPAFARPKEPAAVTPRGVWGGVVQSDGSFAPAGEGIVLGGLRGSPFQTPDVTTTSGDKLTPAELLLEVDSLARQSGVSWSDKPYTVIAIDRGPMAPERRVQPYPDLLGRPTTFEQTFANITGKPVVYPKGAVDAPFNADNWDVVTPQEETQLGLKPKYRGDALHHFLVDGHPGVKRTPRQELGPVLGVSSDSITFAAGRDWQVEIMRPAEGDAQAAANARAERLRGMGITADDVTVFGEPALLYERGLPSSNARQQLRLQQSPEPQQPQEGAGNASFTVRLTPQREEMLRIAREQRQQGVLRSADAAIRQVYGHWLPEEGAAPVAHRVFVQNDSDFNASYAAHHTDNPELIAGFVPPGDLQPAFVRQNPDGYLEDVPELTATHEMMHLYQNDAFAEAFSRLALPGSDVTHNLKEGIAEYLSFKIAGPKTFRARTYGYNEYENTAFVRGDDEAYAKLGYPEEAIAVEQMANVVGTDHIARAFFQGDQTSMRIVADTAKSMFGFVQRADGSQGDLMPIGSGESEAPIDFHTITREQTAVLPPAEIANMTGEDIAALAQDPSRLSALDNKYIAPRIVADIPENVIPLFTPEQFAQFVGEQRGYLTYRQIANATGAQLVALTPRQLAMFNGGQRNAIGAEQRRALNMDQLDALNASYQLTPFGRNEIGYTPNFEYKGTVHPNDLLAQRGTATAAFAADWIRSIPGRTFGEITSENIARLTPREFASITREQQAWMTLDQMRAITPDQLAAMDDPQLGAFSIPQRDVLTDAQKGLLDAGQKGALTWPWFNLPFGRRSMADLTESAQPHLRSTWLGLAAGRPSSPLHEVAHYHALRAIRLMETRGGITAAANGLRNGQKIMLLTGFNVARGMPETDGPPGTAVLGQKLRLGGKDVTYVVDRINEPIMRATLEALGEPTDSIVVFDAPQVEHLARGQAAALLNNINPDTVFPIELPGRNSDGVNKNMRGVDISSFNAPLDAIVLEANRRPDITTLAIGDGGNEAGMGVVHDFVPRALDGSDMASTVPVDHLATASVSNWGAVATAMAFCKLTGRPELAFTPEQYAAEYAAALEAAAASGARDGVTRLPLSTADGISREGHIGWTRLAGKAVEDTQLDILYVGMMDSSDGGVVAMRTFARYLAEATGKRLARVLIADHANAPYGKQAKQHGLEHIGRLTNDALQVLRRVLEGMPGQSIIAMACNTACAGIGYKDNLGNIVIIDLIDTTTNHMITQGGRHIVSLSTSGTQSAEAYSRAVESHPDYTGQKVTEIGASSVNVEAYDPLYTPEVQAAVNRLERGITNINAENQGALADRVAPDLATIVNQLNTALRPPEADIQVMVDYHINRISANDPVHGRPTSLYLTCTHYPDLIPYIKNALERRGMGDLPVVDPMRSQVEAVVRELGITVEPQRPAYYQRSRPPSEITSGRYQVSDGTDPDGSMRFVRGPDGELLELKQSEVAGYLEQHPDHTIVDIQLQAAKAILEREDARVFHVDGFTNLSDAEIAQIRHGIQRANNPADGTLHELSAPILDENGKPVLDENGSPKFEAVESCVRDAEYTYLQKYQDIAALSRYIDNVLRAAADYGPLPTGRTADLNYLHAGHVIVSGRAADPQALKLAVSPDAFAVVARKDDLPSLDQLVSDITSHPNYRPGQDVVLCTCEGGTPEPGSLRTTSLANQLSNRLGARVHAVDGDIVVGNIVDVAGSPVRELPGLPLMDVSPQSQNAPATDPNFAAQQRFWLQNGGRGTPVEEPFGHAMVPLGGRVDGKPIDNLHLGTPEDPNTPVWSAFDFMAPGRIDPANFIYTSGKEPGAGLSEFRSDTVGQDGKALTTQQLYERYQLQTEYLSARELSELYASPPLTPAEQKAMARRDEAVSAIAEYGPLLATTVTVAAVVPPHILGVLNGGSWVMRGLGMLPLAISPEKFAPNTKAGRIVRAWNATSFLGNAAFHNWTYSSLVGPFFNQLYAISDHGSMFQNAHEARTGDTNSPPRWAKLANLGVSNAANTLLMPLYSVPAGPVAWGTNLLFGGGTGYLTYRAAGGKQGGATGTRVATGAVALGLAGFGIHYLLTSALPNYAKEERRRGAQGRPGEPAPTPTLAPTPSPFPSTTAPTSPPSTAPGTTPPPPSAPGERPGPGESPTPPELSSAELDRLLAGLAAQKRQRLNWRTSIVDLMKVLGLNSSRRNRKELAAELGYKGDPNDSAARNIYLQERVRQGVAENGGKVPEWLKD